MIRRFVTWWTGGHIRTRYGRNPMRPFGRVLYSLGMFRLHRDGDGASVVFRWWHPLCWCLFIIMIPPCAFVGEKVQEVVPFRVSKFWRECGEPIEWL